MKLPDKRTVFDSINLIIALTACLIAYFALNQSKQANEASRQRNLIENTPTVIGIYDSDADRIHFVTNDPAKSISAGKLIFPSDTRISSQDFVVPENSIDFTEIRNKLRPILFEHFDLISGKVPDIGSYIRFPLPVGVMVLSSKDGGAFVSCRRYRMIIGFDVRPALGGDSRNLTLKFLAMVNEGTVELPGFRIKQPFGKQLSKAETEAAIEARRVEDVKKNIDMYWNYVLTE